MQLQAENILLSEFYSAKVSDFGESRIAPIAFGATMTAVGTPWFV